MTIEQLTAQLLWLLDQRADVYEHAGSGNPYVDHDEKLTSWSSRIDATRRALRDRQEIQRLTETAVTP